MVNEEWLSVVRTEPCVLFHIDMMQGNLGEFSMTRKLKSIERSMYKYIEINYEQI